VYPTPSVSQTPFFGNAASIPGIIEAENYDNGGEGVAYHDADIVNNGAAYRSDSVDVKSETGASNGYAVGWNATGEWLEYTVTVATAGTYNIDVRASSGLSTGAFHIEFNGVDKTGSLTVPNTGSYDTFTTVSKSGVTLSAGTYIMRLYVDSEYFDLDSINITLAAPTYPTPQVYPTPVYPTPYQTPESTTTSLAQGPFSAQYYTLNIKKKTFDKLLLTRTDSVIDFDWGTGSPDPLIPSDNFGARWTGTINVPANATYSFTAVTDDGIRVWIDGTQVLNKWINQPPTTYTFTKSLKTGKHTIRVDYYELSGGATAKLSWKVAQVLGASTSRVFSQKIAFDYSEVANIQSALVRLGFMSLEPTGFFGPITEKAVKDFQCEEGIVCSGDPDSTGWGQVGPTTWGKLMSK
jgi:hypothetical protein